MVGGQRLVDPVGDRAVAADRLDVAIVLLVDQAVNLGEYPLRLALPAVADLDRPAPAGRQRAQRLVDGDKCSGDQLARLWIGSDQDRTAG